MTPEEAVARLIEAGVIGEERPRGSIRFALQTIEAVKTTETRRNSALASTLARASETMDFGCGEDITEFLRGFANDILTTGGLEAEE